MARTGAVVLEATGDEYKDGCRISTVQWTGDENGALTAGNIIILRARETGEVLWRSRYPDSVGLTLPEAGVAAPNGFVLSRRDAGVLLVYLREDI